ncbi:lipopolysaccharide assembly protein LapB [Corticibacter populi]|uniref:Lipopolysaccharide assembly protein B n=1 Tax=Corticibacter populi TaxID=1550736 RepID=A0A3M6QU62_9BURK|nr:lipopolysaccharide assembly protein LapB [Corticibacter populi]RMX06567.1 lipopolysaccharide assembly protein LapB [Corticibacter populi]RZS31866.1 lipopolysaccharide biosynthesis regulator YciM [Corticibacter populi]
MELEWSWLLLGLPIAFVLGWLASRLDWRQMRMLQRSSPRTYFQGLTYLLNEQQDKAIDVFVEAVQSDPDTVELHFALGNLFRRRGEYDRAVRVHEHLLARADLSGADRARAQFDLAQDFLKAGLLDRAEAALQKLDGTALESQARLALLYIYERVHDWPQACQLLDKMTPLDGQPLPPALQGRLVHYLCEQARTAMQRKDYAEAQRLLDVALATPQAGVRPRIEQVDLLLLQGCERDGIEAILHLADAEPETLALLAGKLVNLSLDADQRTRAHAMLQQHYAQQASLDVLLALVALEQQQGNPRASDWYIAHLHQHPSLVAAARWLEDQPAHADLQPMLEKAAQPLLRYRCVQCGFETRHYFWQCPGCQSWESFPPRRIEEL